MLSYVSQNNIIIKNTSLNMVSKKDIKLISSLKQKKFRFLNKSFVVEGKKSISEFLDSKFELIKLFSIDCSFFADVNRQVEVNIEELKKRRGWRGQGKKKTQVV